MLLRWRLEDGKQLAELTLLEGRALAVLGAGNQRHVGVSARAAGTEPGRRASYLLRYFEIESGELVTKVESERSVGPFAISGGRLLSLAQPTVRRVGEELVETPLALVATDLTGSESWRRPVRDHRFRGPRPPGR